MWYCPTNYDSLSNNGVGNYAIIKSIMRLFEDVLRLLTLFSAVAASAGGMTNEWSLSFRKEMETVTR